MSASIQQIARAAGAFSVGIPGDSAAPASILTDSRALAEPESTIFFALRTPRRDGHDFVGELQRRGVRTFVVDHLPADADISAGTFLVVPDTLAALRAVGALHRCHASERIAITGSRGKTTLKEWLFRLLSPDARIARSPRSFNSQIGVPLSLWDIPEGADLAIIEAGVSREGEMAPIARAIAPHTVIFTNIGAEHDDGFTSRAAKAAEKALLAAGADVRTILYPADDPDLAAALQPLAAGRDTISWSRSNPQADLHLLSSERRDGRTFITYSWRGAEASADFTGTSAADEDNALAALALLRSRGIGAGEAERRLAALRPVDTRLDVLEGVNGCTLIYDGFEADIPSLRPAIDLMRRRADDALPPTVILSDLHAPGESTNEAYAALAAILRAAGVRRLIGIGPEMQRRAHELLPGAEAFASTDDFLAHRSPSDFSAETVLIKGGDGLEFTRILEMLEARKHETVLEVDLDAVGHNYNYFRSMLPSSTGLIAMVKASAYGAGSYEIARTLQERGAAYLAVAVPDEGIDLRHRGITMPIMVMNPKVTNYKSLFSYRLEPEIYTFDMLADVVREARKNGVAAYPVHIKLDTGMHRMGFTEEELPALMDALCAQDAVDIRSVFSHLATADCPDMDDYTLLQLRTFERCSAYIASRWPRRVLRHVLNSAGIVRFPQYHYDMARLGIGLYGVATLPEPMERGLECVSALRTVIIAIREWPAGTTIGYGRRGRLERPGRVATIPIGYADGMNRRFGGGAISVLVGGKEAPTIGNICMDACMIDVTDIDCAVGDSVEIFGPTMSVQRLADALGTIPYEILTSVSPRVKRVYYRG